MTTELTIQLTTHYSLMDFLEIFKPITTFVFDVDGVLTDGSLTLLPGGVMARTMNAKDGYALQLAVKKGYKLAIISGGTSAEVVDRLTRLGVTAIFMTVKDKIAVLKEFMAANNLSAKEVLYMGDDIPDLEVMKMSGIACCPNDAVYEIKEISAYISHVPGGRGCARDVIEKVLKIRGHWSEDTHITST